MLCHRDLCPSLLARAHILRDDSRKEGFEGGLLSANLISSKFPVKIYFMVGESNIVSVSLETLYYSCLFFNSSKVC